MTLEVVGGAAHALALDLWLWPLDERGQAQHASLRAHLSEEERSRAAAFFRPEHRRRYEIARGRMREILAGYLGCAPRAVPLAAGLHGKPALTEGAGGAGPAFNLSHAGGWAALVAGPHGLALGIDIEPHRAVEPALAERFFSAAEQQALAALPPEEWRAGFFNAWTRKEALLKALGAGLTRPLDSFDVTLSPGSPARLERLSGALAERWQLLPLDLGPGFPGCIAVRHAGEITLTLREGALPLPPLKPQPRPEA
ncbi:MAG: 4'-phosphopantetheinyl transferase superfamily protein [Pseudomonadota bacterium]